VTCVFLATVLSEGCEHRRMRRTLAVGVVAASVVWACAPPMVSMVGDAMVDVGETLRDADSDASAQMVYEGIPCVERVVYDYVYEMPAGGRYASSLSLWSAEVAVDVPPSSVVRAFAVVCGPIRSGLDPSSLCPAGAVCTGDYVYDYYADELDCQTVDVSIGEGRVRATCGSASENVSTSADGTANRSGSTYHWTTARIVVETR